VVGVADSLDALPTDAVDMVGTFRAQLDQLIAMQVRRRRRNTQETHTPMPSSFLLLRSISPFYTTFKSGRKLCEY
jgi:hypothetical protein